MKNAALYLRVSTANKSRQGDAVTFDQNPEVQAQPLRDLVAQRVGWSVKPTPTVQAGRQIGALVWTP